MNTAPISIRSSFVELKAFLIQETVTTYVVNFYAPEDEEVHVVELPKNSVQIEDYKFVGRVKCCTFSLPEWLGIDLEITQFTTRKGEP